MHLLASRDRLRAINADLDHLARVDRLTEVPNRRELEEQLGRLQSASARHHQPLSALVVDVDHFKRVNDQHGHAAGDEVLRDLVRRMSSKLRQEDVLGRWGGEEFVVLLPNTSRTGALIAAERMRSAAAAEAVVLSDGREVRATVSIGCATSSFPPDAELIERADAALYEAKRSGRDRVAIL
jgi:diguanylate cyclase (GGDEF)-like protein